MHFHDLKLTDDPVMSFIPTSLRYVFVEFLKNANLKDVKYNIMPWRKIDNDDTLRTSYRPYQEKAKAAFEQYGYESTDVKAYDGFISNIEPQYLFEKLKAFYEPNMDPDVKDWHDRSITAVPDKSSQSQQPQLTLDITDPAIEIIGSFEQLEELKNLMTTKQLSQDDLKTVLVAVQLNDMI